MCGESRRPHRAWNQWEESNGVKGRGESLTDVVCACVIVCLQAWVNPGPRGPQGPPGATNCTQLTDMPDAGGCGLIPYDVFEPFTTASILQFIEQQNQLRALQNQLRALQQAYNNLSMSVSAVEERVALAGLPSAPTNTTQTNETNPLCGPPRKVAVNSFVISYFVQDPANMTSNKTTQCSSDALAKFQQALIKQVNIKDPCAPINNKTRVNVDASCDQVGPKAEYTGAIEIYSLYPCR